ncbi:hypothetical protein BC628DRAFT_357844 [Trametes gibbosa]|nr:hypothetical protein BC628DRAFT_357844 [Trametes gibbosa]
MREAWRAYQRRTIHGEKEASTSRHGGSKQPGVHPSLSLDTEAGCLECDEQWGAGEWPDWRVRGGRRAGTRRRWDPPPSLRAAGGDGRRRRDTRRAARSFKIGGLLLMPGRDWLLSLSALTCAVWTPPPDAAAHLPLWDNASARASFSPQPSRSSFTCRSANINASSP